MDFLQGTVLRYIADGGPMMYPLMLTAIIGLTFIIERWWILRKAKVNTEEFLEHIRVSLLKKRSIKEAIKVCEQYQGPIANILKAGLLKYGTSDEEIEKSIEIAVAHELSRLERGLAVLGSVSNVSPLLGFLGTVTGMIAGFDALAEAGLEQPQLVAKGIAQALITTATGLIIGIPTLMAYNFYTSRIEKFVLEMETSTNMLLETFAAMEADTRPVEKATAAG